MLNALNSYYNVINGKMETILKYVSEKNRKKARYLTETQIAIIIDDYYNNLEISDSEEELNDIKCDIPNVAKSTNNSSVSKVTQQVLCNTSYISNSSILGQIGEQNFETIIDKYLSVDYKIKNMSKIGKSGDFIISWQSEITCKIYNILIEVKNYSNSVPTKEIEKFYRDININNVDSGILLSFNSRITGISKKIDFSNTINGNKKIPIIFINTKTPELISEIIKLYFKILELKDRSHYSIDYHNNIITHIDSFCKSVDTISKCRDDLQVTKNMIDKNISDIIFKLMGCEYELSDKIRQIQCNIRRNKESSKSNEINKNATLTNNIIQQLGFSISHEYDKILYQIFRLKWDNYELDSTKRKVKLFAKEEIIVKFNKRSASIIIPYVDQMKEYVKINKIIMRKNNINLQISKDNIKIIIDLINYCI